MLCVDIDRDCRKKPRLKLVFVAYELTAAISTFGKHFPFGSGNAVKIEARDEEKGLCKEDIIASEGEKEIGNGHGIDVTLLPASDDLLRRCVPCLSRFVSKRFIVFYVS